MLSTLQYHLLRRIAKPVIAAPAGPGPSAEARVSAARAKLTRLLGPELLDEVKGKCVIDFGCGEGDESLALASAGAKEVIGLDIREEVLTIARRSAEALGLSETCIFSTQLPADVRADVIVSIDAFEHFAEPDTIFELMHSLVRGGGKLLVSFGPTWYHPLGGHTFSVFPWAHLMFTEKAFIRWRSHFKDDGATRFTEVAGGLNKMTIRRFERLVGNSPFRKVELQPVPIRRLQRVHSRMTREFTTAVVRGCFEKPFAS